MSAKKENWELIIENSIRDFKACKSEADITLLLAKISSAFVVSSLKKISEIAQRVKENEM